MNDVLVTRHRARNYLGWFCIRLLSYGTSSPFEPQPNIIRIQSRKNLAKQPFISIVLKSMKWTQNSFGILLKCRVRINQDYFLRKSSSVKDSSVGKADAKEVPSWRNRIFWKTAQ